MPPVAVTLTASAAVYAYVGVFYAMLHVRRSERSYAPFGLMCFCIAIWTLSSAVALHWSDPASVLRATALQYGAGFVAAGAFVVFAQRFVDRPDRRVRVAAAVVGAAGVLAAAVGLLLESGAEGSVSLTLLGWALVSLALSLCGLSTGRLIAHVRVEPDTKPIAIAAGLVTLLATVDIVARGRAIPPLYLLEHSHILPVMAVSFVLLRRFARSARQLEARTGELRRSYAELRTTQEELVRKEQLAAVGELSAVIAHEVRNPLAIIKNAVSSLRRPKLKEGDAEVLRDILDEEIDRLDRLVRDLLAYARPVVPQGEPVAINALLEAEAQKALEGADTPAVKLVLELGSVPQIEGDPELLRQAFGNIIDNALQAMPSGGHLTLRTSCVEREGESWVRAEVLDEGEGMDATTREKAPAPFFTTRPSGTGLGLAIVERVIKNHGGDFDITSRDGEGTSVEVWLPLERTGPLAVGGVES